MRSHEVQYTQPSQEKFVPHPKLQKTPKAPSESELEPYMIYTFDQLEFTRKVSRSKITETAFKCKSDNQAEWLLYPPLPENQLTLHTGLLPLNGAREVLQNIQRYKKDSKSIDPRHTETLLFIAANADLLADIIFYKPDQLKDNPQITSVYTEVDMNYMHFNLPKKTNQAPTVGGQADLILDLPDHQLSIVEVGSGTVSKKSQQGAKQFWGLNAILNEVNHGQVNPISLFIAKYHISNAERTINFYPGKPDEISVYEGIEVFNSKKN